MATEGGKGAKWRRKLQAWLDWVRRTVPFGLRSLLGLALIVGGIFGFLPILGFWMIPLGIAVVAIDARQIWDLITRR